MFIFMNVGRHTARYLLTVRTFNWFAQTRAERSDKTFFHIMSMNSV